MPGFSLGKGKKKRDVKKRKKKKSGGFGAHQWGGEPWKGGVATKFVSQRIFSNTI